MKKNLSGTEIIPGWEVVSLLGKDCLSAVYEAKKTDSGAGEECYSAIRVISVPESEDEADSYRDDGYDEEAIAGIFRSQVDDFGMEYRMHSECMTTANIVRCEDFLVVPHDGWIGWDVIIRMEFLTPLPVRLREEGMTEREVVSLGTDICTALEQLSRLHIFYRDIKPQNIFLDEFGNNKLGDIGLALAKRQRTYTSAEKPSEFTAPEVFSGRLYDERAELYSLGLMMYWLLNERRLPFLPLPPAIGTLWDRNEAISRRISGEKIPAPKNGSDALKEIILKACEADPEKRFPSPAEMKNALLALGEVPENTVLVPSVERRVNTREAAGNGKRQ